MKRRTPRVSRYRFVTEIYWKLIKTRCPIRLASGMRRNIERRNRPLDGPHLFLSPGRIIQPPFAAISGSPGLSEDLSSASAESIAILSLLLAPIRCSEILARSRKPPMSFIRVDPRRVKRRDRFRGRNYRDSDPSMCTRAHVPFARSSSRTRPEINVGIAHCASGHGSPPPSLALSLSLSLAPS